MLARLVFAHHHLHWLHQLPSATSPGDRVSSSLYNSGVFSGGLPFALIWLGLELLSSSLLRRHSMRVALLFGPLAPVWPPGLLSHWCTSQMVSLTLVLRLVASAELWLYMTSLPRLIISRTIWVDSIKMIPFGPKQNVPWVYSRTCNLPAALVTLSLWLWNLTGTAWGWLVWSNKAAGGSMVFQEATGESAGKVKKLTACHLMPHSKHLGK